MQVLYLFRSDFFSNFITFFLPFIIVACFPRKYMCVSVPLGALSFLGGLILDEFVKEGLILDEFVKCIKPPPKYCGNETFEIFPMIAFFIGGLFYSLLCLVVSYLISITVDLIKNLLCDYK